MPSGKKKDKEKYNILTSYLNGKYVPYNGPHQAERMLYDTQEFLKNTDPAFFEEWNEVYNSYFVNKTRTSDTIPPAMGLMTAKGMNPMDRFSVDLDAEYEILKYSRKINKKIGEYIDNLEGTGLEFKEYLQALKASSDYESGDYTRALNDSPVIAAMKTLVAYGPTFKKKTIIKSDAEINEEAIEKNIPVKDVEKERTEIDFDAMKEGLGQAFLPYMEMYKDHNALLSLEYEKQKLEDEHADAEAEADFKERYRLQLEKTVRDFKTLRQVEIDNPGVYDQKFLNNSLDHLVGVSPDQSRSIEKEIAFMEGQAKALENGWSLEDSATLGIINANATYLARVKGHLEIDANAHRVAYERRAPQLEEVKKELEGYANVTMTKEQLEKLREPYEKEINAYAIFAFNLKRMEREGKS